MFTYSQTKESIFATVYNTVYLIQKPITCD